MTHVFCCFHLVENDELPLAATKGNFYFLFFLKTISFSTHYIVISRVERIDALKKCLQYRNTNLF